MGKQVCEQAFTPNPDLCWTPYRLGFVWGWYGASLVLKHWYAPSLCQLMQLDVSVCEREKGGGGREWWRERDDMTGLYLRNLLRCLIITAVAVPAPPPPPDTHTFFPIQGIYTLSYPSATHLLSPRPISLRYCMWNLPREVLCGKGEGGGWRIRHWWLKGRLYFSHRALGKWELQLWFLQYHVRCLLSSLHAV